MIKTCKFCEKRFKATSIARKYCTTACQRASANEWLREYNNTNFAKCKMCGESVKVRNMINNVCTKCRNQGKEQNARKGSSICWDCKRELNTCKWVVCHKPVYRWDAVRNDIDGAESYAVKKCPNFMEKRLKRQ